MAGNLGFDELKAAVKAGSIDTVLVAMVDMQGRLIGKRFQAEYFVDGAHEETHGCDYLLANDIDMEPVPGYAAASWDKGYGDFVLKPDLATLRHAALARRHGAGAGRRARPSPSRRAAFAARDAQAPDRAARGAQDARVLRLRARVLPVRRDLQVGGGQALPRPRDRRRLHRGLSHPADHQGGGRHARHPPRPAGRRHPRRELQGRVGPGPGGDQRPLCRRAGDGRPPRHPQERRQGDRARAGQGRHLHVQVALRPRRLLRAHPSLAVGRGRQEAAVPRRQGRARHVGR